ncbi:MAG: nucleotidyltransferase family protein [Candidatus Limivicinus sp.]
MEAVQELFLQAMRASLENKKVEWETALETEQWLALFQMAEKHNVLPLIYDAVYSCPAARKAEGDFFTPIKRRCFQMVMLQTQKTNEFLRLYTKLREAGIKPCVVKGIICRNIYPNPDYRLSSDEDILIPAEQFPLCHETMLAYGIVLCEPEMDIHEAYEVPYGKPGSPIYIELHKSLFPPDSEAYGDLNRFFVGITERLTEVRIQGTPVYTMGHTDHLFYLLCHAFKHFLHSGFGLRQVCDIVLYANAYGDQIDWERIVENCREIRAELFTAALFKIGENYLCFDADKACYPAVWKELDVDEAPMLDDLLDSGIYGGSNMSRKHSSSITLNAVSAQKQGKKPGNHVLKTVFPPAKALEGRFPYLKEHPYLLPVAWTSRLFHYQKELQRTSDNDAAESIRIGNQRIELMKEYGIIDE